MTIPEFPAQLGGNDVVEHQRIAAREDEVPYQAVVLVRNPARPEDRAYEVCNAAVRGGMWVGFSTEHSMSYEAAEIVYWGRIGPRA